MLIKGLVRTFQIVESSLAVEVVDAVTPQTMTTFDREMSEANIPILLDAAHQAAAAYIGIDSNQLARLLLAKGQWLWASGDKTEAKRAFANVITDAHPDMALQTIVDFIEMYCADFHDPTELDQALVPDRGVPGELSNWLREEVERGHPGWKNVLGIMFGKGLGVPPDKGKAMEFHSAAAKEGSILAQYTLGRIYLTGDGVQRDVRTARTWLDVAARHGSKKAARLLSQMNR